MRSNKPVLPTAPTSPNSYPTAPLRRQTGQPFGSLRRCELGSQVLQQERGSTQDGFQSAMSFYGQYLDRDSRAMTDRSSGCWRGDA